MQRTILSTLLAAMFIAFSIPVLAADQDRTRTQDQQQVRDQDIYGYRLMTPQERDAHRAKMRSAKTIAERDRIRQEHHTQMQIRAKEQGVTLPDEPPSGRGPGSGTGGGAGPGGGGRR